MNILGFNIQISRAAEPLVQKSLGTTPEQWLRGEDIVQGALLSNAYEQVVWVYRAINALAEQVANVPFLFSAGERGRENLITTGPLLDLYARPHPQLNRFQYWELRVIWLMLRGECFRIPIYEEGQAGTGSRGRKIKSILMPDPASFQHVIEDHRLIGWRYTRPGPQAPLASQVFLPEEVWFERLPNPFDFWRGLPPFYVAASAAKTDFAAGAFMRGIIENNADGGLIVRTEKWLSDEQRQQIICALRDRKRKAGLADRPVLLSGSAEVIRPQLSSTDLQFLENRKFSRAEICAAFGVPEEIVTTTDHSKYDVMAGARLNFIENRIAPLCSRLEAEEDVTIKQIDPRASGWFDLDSLPILQDARRNRLAAARTGFEMGVPFNELNRVLDLGFKPLPWGDRGYLSAKLQQVSADTPAKTTNHLQLESTNEKGREPEPTAAAQQTRMDRPHKESTPAHETKDPVARASHFLSGLKRLTLPNPQILRKLSRFFFEQRCRALARLPEFIQNPQLHILDPIAENNQLIEQLRPFLEAELTCANPGLSSAEISSYAERRRSSLEQINRATLENLRNTVQEGLANQEPPEQLKSRVKAVFCDATSRRLDEIAGIETEAVQAFQPPMNPSGS
jgi:HK97 family phage portal protein